MKSKQRKAKQQRRWARAAVPPVRIHLPPGSASPQIEPLPDSNGWMRFSCLFKPGEPGSDVHLCFGHQPMLEECGRLAVRAYENRQGWRGASEYALQMQAERNDLRHKLHAATDAEAKATLELNASRENGRALMAEAEGMRMALEQDRARIGAAESRAAQAEAQVKTLQRLSAAKDLTIAQLRAELAGPHETPWHARQMEIRRARYAMEQRRSPWWKRPAVVLGEYIPALEGLSPTAAGRVVVPFTVHNGGVA